MARNKGSIYNFPNTAQGFGDYVTQDLMPQPGGRSPSSKPSVNVPAPKQKPNYQFNKQNFKAPSSSSAAPMSVPAAPSGGTDWGAWEGSNYSLLDSDQNFNDAMNTISDMSKKDPSFQQQLQGMSATDKIQLASSAVASGAAGMEAQTKGQAIAGGISSGVSAGMAAASMASMGAAAATGVGAVVALGVALAGMNSAKQAENRRQDEIKKQEKKAQKAEELRLLSTYHDRRAQAMNNLVGAFRRR